MTSTCVGADVIETPVVTLMLAFTTFIDIYSIILQREKNILTNTKSGKTHHYTCSHLHQGCIQSYNYMCKNQLYYGSCVSICHCSQHIHQCLWKNNHSIERVMAYYVI